MILRSIIRNILHIYFQLGYRWNNIFYNESLPVRYYKEINIAIFFFIYTHTLKMTDNSF